MPLAIPRPERSILNDADIAAETRAGNPEALAALYEKHAKALLAVAYRLLGSRDDAEDVLHDVFVGLPEALHRYEERGSFVAWLRTITARVALARLRERSVRATLHLEDVNAAAVTYSSDASLTLERALLTLSPNHRAVIVLKEIEGFSHREIAAMLDISVAASEVRLHRALRALRAQLTKENDS